MGMDKYDSYQSPLSYPTLLQYSVHLITSRLVTNISKMNSRFSEGFSAILQNTALLPNLRPQRVRFIFEGKSTLSPLTANLNNLAPKINFNFFKYLFFVPTPLLGGGGDYILNWVYFLFRQF